MNIIKCPNCRYSLIAEEIDSHICKEPLDCKIEGDIAYFFDGQKWYPVVRFTQQPKGNTDTNNPRGNRTRNDKVFIFNS